jgi:pSer/pThr/pTyr-binding forkhead associated (FHA) protein
LFTIDGDEVKLRDLGSTNGTVVNGERIQGEVAIRPNDLVEVGPLRFQAVFSSTPALEPEPLEQTTPSEVPVPTAAVAISKLGSRDASESDIHQFLMSDTRHEVPDSGSGVYSGDTQMLDKTTVDRAADQDTQTDLVAPLSAESEEKVVETADGIKIKITSAKQKIEKTREDTSRAAADILRKMLERRPGK